MLWAHGRGSVRREVDHRELCPQLQSVRCTSSTSQLGTQLSWRRSLLTHAALYCCMCAVLAFELECLHDWCTPGLVCSVHDEHQLQPQPCTAHNGCMLGVCADCEGAGPSACLLACGRLLHQSIVVPRSHGTLQCNTAAPACTRPPIAHGNTVCLCSETGHPQPQGCNLSQSASLTVRLPSPAQPVRTSAA